jgi:hypothetical protein
MAYIKYEMYLELDADTREPLVLVEVAINEGQGETCTSSLSAQTQQTSGSSTLIRSGSAGLAAPEPTGLLQIRSWSAARLDIQAANDALWEPISEQGELFAQRSQAFSEAAQAYERVGMRKKNKQPSQQEVLRRARDGLNLTTEELAYVYCGKAGRLAPTAREGAGASPPFGSSSPRIRSSSSSPR